MMWVAGTTSFVGAVEPRPASQPIYFERNAIDAEPCE
jgi:hypothetical protein